MLLRATEDGDIEVFLQMHSRGEPCVGATSEAHNESDCEWTLPWVEAGAAENLLIQTGTAGERRWGRRDHLWGLA